MIGVPIHYQKPGRKDTACGRVGVRFASNTISEVECVVCRRWLRAVRRRPQKDNP